MSAQPIKVRTPRPPPPRYEPGRCYALASPDDTSTHCLEPARFYPCGWRCDDCAPGAHKTSRETSPTTQKEAA